MDRTGLPFILALALALALAVALSACASDPGPQLPSGKATSRSDFADEAFLRGVVGSAMTVPPARDAAILDVTYAIECVAANAEARFNDARRILDERFVVAPLLAINARERTGWAVSASSAVEATGCVVNRVDFAIRTTDPRETMLWAVTNRVPPAR